MTRRRAPQIDPRDTLRAEIAALPSRRTSDPVNGATISVDMLRPAYAIVIEAAKARRMSVPAYIRRAAYAFAALDLDIPLSAVLERDSRLTRDTGFPISDPEGTKLGPWEIARLFGEGVDREQRDGTAGS